MKEKPYHTPSAPRITSEGIPSHKFSGMETVDFKSKVTFEGEYLLLFTATGDERAQIQVCQKKD